MKRRTGYPIFGQQAALTAFGMPVQRILMPAGIHEQWKWFPFVLSVVINSYNSFLSTCWVRALGPVLPDDSHEHLHFGQYSDAALQALGLNNWVVSDTYRGFTPASMAGNGGDEVCHYKVLRYLHKSILPYNYSVLLLVISWFVLCVLVSSGTF